jgi:hypothetical protein
MMSSAPHPTTGNPTPPAGRCAPEPRQALEKWEEGYQGGAAGKPGKAGQSYAYYSGWIEGDGARPRL